MGQPAKAAVRALRTGEPSEFRTVKDAMDAARERNAPGDEHHCPLCNDYFPWEVFQRHAPDCIRRFKAGRQHIWAPPGTPNAPQNYDTPVKIAHW
jgi:hypothetical protein